MPPSGHFNSFVGKSLGWGIYYDLMQSPMAMYYWDKGEYMPQMATKWEIKEPDQFVVTLRQGAKWSDGAEFTAQDVVDTFTIGRFYKWVVWRYVGNIEATDKYTVTFTMSTPSSVVPRYVLKEKIPFLLPVRRVGCQDGGCAREGPGTDRRRVQDGARRLRKLSSGRHGRLRSV